MIICLIYFSIVHVLRTTTILKSENILASAEVSTLTLQTPILLSEPYYFHHHWTRKQERENEILLQKQQQEIFINKATISCKAAIYLSYLCFLIELAGILSGVSLFSSSMNLKQVNFFSCFLHFIGGLLVTWFIEYTWEYEKLWGIVIFTSVIPALIEISVFFIVFRLLKETY